MRSSGSGKRLTVTREASTRRPLIRSPCSLWMTSNRIGETGSLDSEASSGFVVWTVKDKEGVMHHRGSFLILSQSRACAGSRRPSLRCDSKPRGRNEMP